MLPLTLSLPPLPPPRILSVLSDPEDNYFQEIAIAPDQMLCLEKSTLLWKIDPVWI